MVNRRHEAGSLTGWSVWYTTRMANPLTRIMDALPLRHQAPEPEVIDAPAEVMAEVVDATSTGTGLTYDPQSIYGEEQPLTHGGIVNRRSGVGTNLDKTEGSGFYANRIRRRQLLEVMYAQSWAAAKFINIPVNDAFVRPREWVDADEAAQKRMEEAEKHTKVKAQLKRAMIAARLYGTSVLVMVCKDASLETPLIPERLKEGDLTHLLVYDRYSLSIEQVVTDPYSPMYGMPEFYRISPRYGASFYIHESRLIRFDGREAPTSDSWENYDMEWGLSELLAAISEVFNDATSVAAVAHLMQEASIPIVKVDGLRNSMKGRPSPDEPTIMEIGQAINLYKSIFKTMFIDNMDDITRLTVNFTGLPEMVDRFALRLAAAADIPATRFMAQSPAGMNATGTSDMNNYSIRIGELQEHMIRPALDKLDIVVARSAGLREPLDYKFPPLIEATALELAELTSKNAETLRLWAADQLLTPDEARERISGDQLFGDLGPLPEDAFPEPEMPPELPPMIPGLPGSEPEDDEA